MNDWISVKEAAEIYGCSNSRIYQLIEDGQLTSEKKYGVRVVLESEVRKLSEANKEQRRKWKESMRKTFAEEEVAALTAA